MARGSFLALMSLCMAVTGSRQSKDGWDPVRKILSDYFPMSDFAFSAGNASGRQFYFEKGSTTMSTPMIMASSSKFPAAIAVVGCVADRHLSFDSFAHEVWPWWTSEPSDRRSRVTLRNLLSFTSGFYASDAGGELPCLSGQNASSYTAEACAHEIYSQAPFEFEPGSTWSYNSFHLQVAGAMAAAAAGVTVQELLDKYLIKPLNLTGTFWMGGQNPVLAGNMVTTGADYDKILRAHVSNELLPKTITDEMELDYLQPPVKIANASVFLAKLLGHYSMCTYFECLEPKLVDFSDRCKKANVHVDAGLFGYYPLVDRANGMYMQVVRMKIPTTSSAFYAPTIASIVLRQLVKGSVDRALGAPRERKEGGASFQRALWFATKEVLRKSGLESEFKTPEEVWSSLREIAAPEQAVFE